MNTRKRSLQFFILLFILMFSACRKVSQVPVTEHPTQTVFIEQNTPTLAEPTRNPANADVIFVRAVQNDNSTWTFYVTVDHPDTGWDDYADGWDVVLPDGTVIKPDPDNPFTRLLTHPHENEQPFTRSQSGIVIPVDAPSVTIRAHDIVDGFGGREIMVDFSQLVDTNYQIEKQVE